MYTFRGNATWRWSWIIARRRALVSAAKTDRKRLIRARLAGARRSPMDRHHDARSRSLLGRRARRRGGGHGLRGDRPGVDRARVRRHLGAGLVAGRSPARARPAALAHLAA